LEACVENGRIVEGLVVSKSGASRNMLRMVPPMCLAETDVDVMAVALERCFEKY
jgi:4-aminobutyrate aminotransferase-like enzyme